MKSVKILGQVAEKHGVKDLEIILFDLYKVLGEAAPLIAIDAECSAAEKAIGGGLALVLPNLETLAKGMADLNKDGVIG